MVGGVVFDNHRTGLMDNYRASLTSGCKISAILVGLWIGQTKYIEYNAR